MRRVVLWAAQRTEVLALIKTTTDLNVRDGRHHFFQFDRHQGQHYAIYTAGNDGNVEERFPGTWERQALYFAGWAARVDAEAREGRVPRSP